MPAFPINTPEKSNNREIREKIFEEQFADKQDLDGIEMVKISKETPNDKMPVIFAPGCLTTINTYKNSLKTLSHEGRDAISLNHSGKEKDIENFEKTTDLPEEVQRRATSLYKLIMDEVENGNGKIGIIGHSMGAMDTLAATIMAESEAPGTVKNIVLVNPAGMVGKDSMPGLGKRFIGQMKQNVELKKDENRPESAKENIDVAIKEFFKYIKDNPKRAIKEIYAMTNLQIQDLLIELKGRGIGISIIHGVDDLTFPMDRIQDNTTSEHLDGFYSVKGVHNELYLNPEKYMALAEHALTALENKKRPSSQR